jgi:MFS transporter, AAHS family, benzoate transport protein
MTTATPRTTEQEAQRRSTVMWVVGLAFVGLVFDGYDLVVYGTVVPTLLADASHLGAISPEQAGTLGSELPRTRDRVRAGGA